MSSPPLAVTMLNAIHYQRPEAIIGVLALLPIPMIFAGLLLARCVSIRRVTPVLLMCLVVVGIFGCKQDEHASTPPLIPLTDWSGLPGRTPGRFDVPRGIAVDATGDVLVVDKSARVQRLDGRGGASCVWTMPAFDNGKPTGLGVTADGQVIVADTHEYQVAVFNACGELQRVFGSYGMSPGQFIYPTDVVVSAAGEWFVSEYGGNDRVQVFDDSGSLRRVLGGPGRGSGQFRRPQGLSLSGDGSMLWVADAGNHRVQGIDPMSGQMQVEIGLGTLRSPYGVTVLPDETLVVVENGRHMLSRWSPDGTLLGQWGGWGRAPGRLRMPWGVVYEPVHDVVHVLDTGNSRVQQVPREALVLPLAQ
jgi:DNA-binding beta-propeller fold protein YncE